MTAPTLLSDMDRAQLRRAVPDVEIRDIVREVCDLTGLSFQEVMGPGRHASLVLCRHLAMFVAYRRGHTLQRIGATLNRDHTTVMHGVRAEAKRRGLAWSRVREMHAEAVKAKSTERQEASS